MRWLKWNEIVTLFRTWQGLTLATLGAVATVYYGPCKMLETWDWYWDRFRDGDVLLLLHSRKFAPNIAAMSNFGNQPAPKELPYQLDDIASALGRKNKSVLGSMERLWRRGKVEPLGTGWRLKGQR